MKRLCTLLALALLAATASAQNTVVKNGILTGANNQVPSGSTLTIKSGGTFTIEGGGTITGVQATDATLTALAGQTTAANKLTYWTGTDTAATIDFSPVSQTFLGYTTAAAWRNAIFPASGAEGDLITHDGTNWIRQAIGTTGQVPVVQADGTWAWDDFAIAIDAEDVAYDNSTSGLAATNVQAAIDEIDLNTAPATATYLVQTASTGLSAEQALSTLSTGLMKVTTTTGVVSSVSDSSGLAGSLSDETGTGAAVFGTSPTISALGISDQAIFTESAAPSTPASGRVALYAKSDGLFYSKDDTGAETLVSGGAGGGGGGSALFVGRSAKTTAYTVVAVDKGYLIDCTSGTFSVSLTAAATLNDGFFVGIINSGTGTITIDPNGSETMRDVAGTSTTKTLTRGDCVVLFCSGSEFYVVTATNDFSGTATTVATPKAVSITNSNSASSTSTGALIVTGGAGIGGSLYVNTIATAAGNDLTLSPGQNTTTGKPFIVTDSTDATTAITGAVRVTGGLSARKNIIRGGGSAGIGVNTSGVVYQAISLASSQANTSENDLKTQVLDGNLLATNGDRLRYTTTFSLGANATDKRIRVKFGATTIYDSSAVAANGGQIQVEALITRLTATTQEYTVTVQSSNATMPSTVTYGSAAETLSGAVTLKATSQQGSGAAINDVIQRGVLIEYVPAI
jgi:hypothetical protein